MSESSQQGTIDALRTSNTQHAVNDQDQELIDECLAGQTDAFGRLVVRYQDRLYNTLVNILGSPDDARDIAQEAFVHAFRKLATFRGHAAFYSWLFRIALKPVRN